MIFCRGHWHGRHTCLLHIGSNVANIFHQVDGSSGENKKECRVSGTIRGSDLRYLLIVLPFLMHNLFEDEVAEYNRRKDGGDSHLVDPSAEMIEVCIVLLRWYHLYRRSNPPKDTEDLDELKNLCVRYMIICFSNINICLRFSPYFQVP